MVSPPMLLCYKSNPIVSMMLFLCLVVASTVKMFHLCTMVSDIRSKQGLHHCYQQGSMCGSRQAISMDATTNTKALTTPTNFVDAETGGGVVIFYHVAKTGGTTIREYFHYLLRNHHDKFIYYRYKNPYFEGTWKSSKAKRSESDGAADPRNVDTTSITNNATRTSTTTMMNCTIPIESYDFQLEMMDQLMKEFLVVPTPEQQPQMSSPPSPRKPTLLMEIHDGPPGLRSMESYLKKWRAIAEENNKPIFIFTLMREPTSYAISYYKFFHTGCDEPWCEHYGDEHSHPNIVHFLKTLQSNQQCFLLNHLSSIAGMPPTYYDTCKVSLEDCQYVYNDIMLKSMDYVGTTESLSNVTIPYLSNVILGQQSTVDPAKKSKRQSTRKAIQNVTNAAKHYEFEETIYSSTAIQSKLQEMMKSDIWLYNQVKTRLLQEKSILPA